MKKATTTAVIALAMITASVKAEQEIDVVPNQLEFRLIVTYRFHLVGPDGKQRIFSGTMAEATNILIGGTPYWVFVHEWYVPSDGFKYLFYRNETDWILSNDAKPEAGQPRS